MANQFQSGSVDIRDSVSNAIGNLVSSIEPQLNEFATKAALSALERSRDYARSAVSAARRQPWYFIAGAAVILLGVAALVSLRGPEQSRLDSNIAH
jgi:hypothetical protein